MASFPSVTVITVGRDERLLYLLQRYIEQSGYHMVAVYGPPLPEAIACLRPAVLIFSSIEQLRAAQALIDSLSHDEIPVLVCASPADEAIARELGADGCLLHPLVFDEFCAVLAQVVPTTGTKT